MKTDEGEKERKQYSYMLIAIGLVLTATIIGAILGIPLLVIGILLLKKKVADPPLLNWMANQRLMREKLERKKVGEKR